MTDVTHTGPDDEPDLPLPDVVAEPLSDSEPPEGFEPA